MSQQSPDNLLLSDKLLERSSIVANSLMNRKRVCTGSNSYQKEFGLNILDFLENRLIRQSRISWLDLCCGEGRALLEAAQYFQSSQLTSSLSLVGLDLVPVFSQQKSEFDFLKFETGSILTFETTTAFDLITCSHELHYIGDKLAAVAQAVSRLKNDGLFLAHLDLSNLRDEFGRDFGRAIIKDLRRQGLEYNSRKHLLTRRGKCQLKSNYTYLGADDRAGANYTGQAAVNSFYRLE